MFIVVSLLAPDSVTLADRAIQTVFLVGIFLPFSYLMDVLMYRVYMRRTGQAQRR
jgi:hypothetical protein